MRPTRSRLLAPVLALALGATSWLALPGPAGAARPAAAEAVYELTCANAAPAPALTVRGRAGGLEQRRARAVVAQGARLGVPARAQGLALTAHLAGDVGGVREADAFYRRLMKVEGWQSLPPTLAVHRVVRGADPFGYERGWRPALVELGRATATSTAAVVALTAAGARAPRGCRTSARDPRGLPLPEGTGYTVYAGAPKPAPTPAASTAAPSTPAPTRSPTGAGSTTGAPAATPGAGTRFEASCGTPVVSATAGRVTLADRGDAAGRWQITVRSASDTVSYSHVQQPRVKTGDKVAVGRQLAEVGDLGDVQRCALGLAVRRKAGQELAGLGLLRYLLGGPVRTSPAGSGAGGSTTTASPAPVPQVRTIEATSFRMATLNVLGHHLTEPGGTKPSYASGRTRMTQALALLERQNASIVVLNEFESEQAEVVQGDGDWGLHRATPNDTFRRTGSTGGNAIAWRSDTWELVDTTEVQVAWQRTLHMPVVLLRHLGTGANVLVMGVHNPASTKKQGDQQGAREQARATELDFITEQVESTGTPLLLGGDFNERDSAFCGMTATGLLRSSAGGSTGPACSPPRHGPVDWIFGSVELQFGGQSIDRSPLGSITDHPLVLADVVYPAHQQR